MKHLIQGYKNAALVPMRELNRDFVIGPVALQEHRSSVTALIQVKEKELNIKQGSGVDTSRIWFCSYKIFPDRTAFNVDRYEYKFW